MIRVTINEVDPDTGVVNADIGVPKDARLQIVRGKERIHPPRKAWVSNNLNTNLKAGDRLEVSYD